MTNQNSKPKWYTKSFEFKIYMSKQYTKVTQKGDTRWLATMKYEVGGF